MTISQQYCRCHTASAWPKTQGAYLRMASIRHCNIYTVSYPKSAATYILYRIAKSKLDKDPTPKERKNTASAICIANSNLMHIIPQKSKLDAGSTLKVQQHTAPALSVDLRSRPAENYVLTSEIGGLS